MPGSIVRLALALSFSMGATDTALADGFVIEGNGARAQDRWGGEVGLGYSVDVARFSLRPMGGVFVYAGDNDRYFTDVFDNGQSRCRDFETGRFADSSLCGNTAVSGYGKVELTYTFPAVAEIGGGVRFSAEQPRFYGTASLPLGPALRLRGNAGDRYFALGLLARL